MIETVMVSQPETSTSKSQYDSMNNDNPTNKESTGHMTHVTSSSVCVVHVLLIHARQEVCSQYKLTHISWPEVTGWTNYMNVFTDQQRNSRLKDELHRRFKRGYNIVFACEVAVHVYFIYV